MFTFHLLGKRIGTSVIHGQAGLELLEAVSWKPDFFVVGIKSDYDVGIIVHMLLVTFKFCIVFAINRSLHERA
jgi:hypothetical protein